MIYVDPPVWKKSPNGRKSYGHMVADTLEELHSFAEQVGIKRHFFHKQRSGMNHYDITEDQHNKIILRRDVMLLATNREFLEKVRKMNGK